MNGIKTISQTLSDLADIRKELVATKHLKSHKSKRKPKRNRG